MSAGEGLAGSGAGASKVALVVCGALVQDVQAIARGRGWDADVHAVSPVHHLHPERIAPAVEAKLQELEGRYERVVVVYGDCGTAGRLDEVLHRRGATRPEGPHCYELLAGDHFLEITRATPGTFFLTPWLIRNFNRYVIEGLGIGEHPELVHYYFRNFTDAVYLRRSPDPGLERSAREIAERLGLRLEIRDTGLGELERRVAELVER
jgi:hypothetical protein